MEDALHLKKNAKLSIKYVVQYFEFVFNWKIFYLKTKCYTNMTQT